MVRYLKFFTFLDREAIEALETATTARAGAARGAARAGARSDDGSCTAPIRWRARSTRRSLLFGEDIATLAGRRCAGGVRGCAVDRCCRRRSSTARASRWSISWRASAGAVEERGAAARAVGRRVRQQPTRDGSAGAAHARSGDWRAAVRAAQGAQTAESSGADRLTVRRSVPDTIAGRVGRATPATDSGRQSGGQHEAATRSRAGSKSSEILPGNSPAALLELNRFKACWLFEEITKKALTRSRSLSIVLEGSPK